MNGDEFPVRRGYWWREGRYTNYIEEIEGVPGDLYLSLTGHPVRNDKSWIAPVPRPEVLKELLAYAAAINAIDEAPIDSIERDRAFSAWTKVQERLHRAIRAERDGGA